MSSEIAGSVITAGDISGTSVTVIGGVTISGNQVFISGQPVTISGNTVYVVSGIAHLKAYDPSGQTWNELYVSESGGHNLAFTANVASNVSGNAVRISGEAVKISGENVRLLSGDVRINNVADFSGLAVTTSVVTNISGQVVYLVSGQNDVQISGQPVGVSGQRIRTADGAGTSFIANTPNSDTALANSANTTSLLTQAYMYGFIDASGGLARVRVTSSGQGISGATYKLIVAFSGDPVSISGQPVSISGQTVVASVTTNISGQTVYLTSGQNNVQMSGETVRLISGDAIQTVIRDTQGDSLDINSNSQTDALSVTLNPLMAQAIGYGYDVVQDAWARFRVTASGQGVSGIPHRLIVAFSGDPVSISGQPVSISGQTVVTSVTTNISGQTVVAEISGQEIRNMMFDSSGSVWRPLLTDESGGLNLRVAIGSDNTVGLAAIVDPDNDTRSEINNSLCVLGYSYAYNEASGSFARLRITQSGQGVSGIPHKLVVAFSGDPVRMSGETVRLFSGDTINTVIRNPGGDRTPLIFAYNDAINTFENYLFVGAGLYGYDKAIDQANRLRVTSSGQGMSGIHHRLAVAFSGDFVSFATPATYIVYADNVVPTSGGVAFAMQYRSGVNTIVLKKMFITPLEPALASGQYLRFDVCRISGLFSGGTAITAFPHDPTDPVSGASLNIATAVTNSLFPVAARNILIPWNTTTNGWLISGSHIVTNDPYRIDPLQQTMSILPENPEMKEIRLTSGYGIMLQQTLAQTGYTQVTSGRFGITVVYTVQ